MMKKKEFKIITLLLLSLFLAFIAAERSSDAAIVTFSGYQVQTNGNASLQGSILRLTPAAFSQSGSAFITQPFALAGNTNFSTAFRFTIADSGYGGADGMVFMLQNTGPGALGNNGGYLGYYPINPSIAVEFDTYYNGGWDPSNNHVGIDINGNPASVQTSTSVPDLNGGSPLYAWVDYNAGSNLFEVFVGSSSVKPLVPQLSYTVDLASLLGSTFYAGFSAGTGGAYNRHDIETWVFDSFDGDLGEDCAVLYIKSGDAADGGTAFTDSSASVHTVTPKGNVHHGDSALFGDTAICFDGDGDYLSLAQSNDWNFGTGEFTIDLWVNFAAVSRSYQGIFSTAPATNGFFMCVYNGKFMWYHGAAGWLDTGIKPVAGQWYHLAAVRAGNIFTLYVDGSGVISSDCTGASFASSRNGFVIGSMSVSPPKSYFNGRMDEITVSKGCARWTDDFVPPKNPGQ